MPQIRDISMLPHGGLGLIDRLVPEAERQDLIREASGYKPYVMQESDLSVFNRIADGTLSPLEGPMDSKEFRQVLEGEFIERNGKKFAWTIPIVFPISEKEARVLNIGDIVAVKTEQGAITGTLEISDIYPFDKQKYNSIVYGTARSDHPGPRIANEDSRSWLLGGRIHALPQLKNFLFGKYLFSPSESRSLLRDRGFVRSIAFQTRNPLHRAHEYAMVYAVEQMIREGIPACVVLNPLVGKTKDDDIPATIRMKTYEILIEKRLLGAGDKDDDLWGRAGYELCDRVILMALDMKMFYAGPKEAIMHAIYRQNMGFTDIIIGRKHADAPFDDGTSAREDFDAQDKFGKLKGELLIRPFKIGHAAYIEELGRVALLDEVKEKGFSEISLSGKRLREKLESGEPADDRIMRKEVFEFLREAYKFNLGALRNSIKSDFLSWHYSGITKQDRERKNGHKGICIWLTGLPSSGKSTIAAGLQAELFAKGAQVFILDGDNIRHGLNRDLGFSQGDRVENIRRIGEVAKLFTEAGIIVISAFISPYREDRYNVRSIFEKGNFIEIYVKADITVCESRDDKGLYKKAHRGEIAEFTGVSAPYEEPSEPELVVDTCACPKEQCVQAILTYLKGNGCIPTR